MAADLRYARGMTPPARIQAAIELLEAIDATPDQPADRVARAWLGPRRYIGSI